MLLEGLWRLVRALGHTSIEVREWQEATVRSKRLPNHADITKLATNQPPLQFDGWSLAHAVVKADYLDRRNLTLPGLAFLLQVDGLLELGQPLLALKPGAAAALNDVSLTSLAARVGQGLAVLYGHRLGLAFSGHLRSHVKGLPSLSPAAQAMVDGPMADFLFADEHRTVIVEAKGSFTQADNKASDIKSVLKSALTGQVDPWMNILNPAPANGYVVYSCLREGTTVPSTMFVVDPDEQKDLPRDVPMSPDEVMRENYSAWLRAMGMPWAAARLLDKTGSTSEVRPREERLAIIDIDGRRYAFNAAAEPPYLRRLVLRLGIDLRVLQGLSKVLSNPSVSLVEVLSGDRIQMDEQQRTHSVFPDGSFFGLVGYRSTRYERILL